MINTLFEMFSYTFIVRAFLVGTLVSLCASLLGVSLVLKRYSMIGDGLSHVGFGALAAATAMNAAPLAVSIPVVVTAAFFLLRLSENSKIRGDAAIALISSSALAIGVAVISVTTGMNTDVCNYLFGSILAMSKGDVYLSLVLSSAVLLLFVFFYNTIFAITFDETFARAGGVRTGLYNMLIAFLTAITIVLGMRMMGAMLISSLIIFPALSSMRVYGTFKRVTICSAVISSLSFFMGLVLSYVFATPTGASVVLVNLAVFLLFWAFGKRAAVKKLIGLSSAALLILSGCPASGGVLSTKQNAAGTRSVILPGGIIIEDDSPAGNVQAAAPEIPSKETRAGGFVEIKEKMFIAQTNDVYLNPDEYLGKTIKLEGLFKSDEYPGGGQEYHFVLRYGPGCCGNDGSAGFEVAWEAQTAWPENDAWVEAVGVLDSYEEDGYPYLYLSLVSLVEKEERGAEFVSQ
jgi:zinc transport system permease protein